MKTATLKRLGGMLLAGLLLSFLVFTGAAADAVSGVTRKGDNLFLLRDGKTAPMTEEVTLPGDIKVMTNGLFTVKSGKPRELKNGQRLGADGMLTSPDGSIEPVEDHVARKDGKLVVVRDGESRVLDRQVTLADGTQVFPNGKLLFPGGRIERILDGQLFTLSGVAITAKDTIVLQNGVVFVQKDGSRLKVEPGRSLMMNDGTKVLGDGSVISKDGNATKLTEGEIITLEGVVKNR
jgi:hypothetical protein